MGYALLAVLLIVVPFVCGMIPLSLMHEEHKSILGTYVYGWFVVFALFQLTAIPCIILKTRFTTLCIVFGIVLLLYMVLSCFKFKMVPDLVSRAMAGYKELPLIAKIGWAVVIIALAVQMVFLVFNEYIDGDDAYYLVVSLDSIKFETMYLRNPYTGYPYGGVDIRHALSPVPLFIAFLSKVTGVHSTIVAHSVLGPAFIGLMYGIYTLLGRKLFKDNRKWNCVFVLFVMAFYVFGHVSLYTAETFAYTRTWQGKSMLANLVVPALFLSILYLHEKYARTGEWIFLFLLTIAAVFTTSVAVVFVPVMLFITAILLYLNKGNKKDLLKMAVLLVPCLIFGFLYIMN